MGTVEEILIELHGDCCELPNIGGYLPGSTNFELGAKDVHWHPTIRGGTGQLLVFTRNPTVEVGGQEFRWRETM